MLKLKKIAQEFETTLEEHEGVHPRSYMAFQNLQSTLRYSKKILELMNSEDDFPDWCDDKMTAAKYLLEDVYNYIANEKGADVKGEELSGDVWNELGSD